MAAIIKIPPAAVPEFINTFVFLTFFCVITPTNTLRISFLNLATAVDKIFMLEINLKRFGHLQALSGWDFHRIVPDVNIPDSL